MRFQKPLFALAISLFLIVPQLRAGGYDYHVDISQTNDDKVKVTVTVPQVTTSVIEYHMPKVVPGTYSISDFGRFVSDFQALDINGVPMPVTSLDANRWKIENALQLKTITYWVSDTWDSDLGNKIFEPGGTNIEADKNFVINPFGFFGYLQGMKDVKSTLRVTRPDGFYGSTALIADRSEGNTDIYTIENYNLLADSPIMYCRPDTAWQTVGNAKVLVSVYSPSKRVSAAAVMASLAEVLAAQKEYLGGQLPVEKYAFIIYLTPGFGGSGGMGALEHSYSSFYFMPESDEASTAEQMRDVAAHEFFHIVTPLSIHSEEIHNFDYVDPKMSKHLWLYEGVTEYSASHVQIKYGLISLGEYMAVLQQKMMMAAFMNDTVPFTTMSAGCLDIYKGQYMNVYQKGALIGMCVDILLRDQSKGAFGIQDLMRKLAERYGKQQPFKDDMLFDVIAELSYPGIRDFFRKHVEGGAPIPYAEIFNRVGILYEAASNRELLTTGRVDSEMNPETKRLKIVSTRRMNDFGKKLGYQEGDEIVTFDGMDPSTMNIEDLIAKFRARHKAGDKIQVLVARPDGNGGYKMIKMKAKALAVRQKGTHMISINPGATPEQLAVRKSWIGV